MGNERIKIHDLAKKLNTTGKRIVEKLQEINIEKSIMASLDQEELKAFYNHIGYMPESEKHSEHSETSSEGEKKEASPSAGKSRAKTPSSSGKPTGIIMRRIVYNEDSSYSDAPSASERTESSKTGKKNSRAPRAAASSGLRQGYTVRHTESYEELMKTARAESPKQTEKPAAPAAQNTSKGPVVKRVTRIKAGSTKPAREEETVHEKISEPVQQSSLPKDETSVEKRAAVSIEVEESVKETQTQEKISSTPDIKEQSTVQKESSTQPSKSPKLSKTSENQEQLRNQENLQNAQKATPSRTASAKRPDRGVEAGRAQISHKAPANAAVPGVPGTEQRKTGYSGKSFEKPVKKNNKKDFSRPQNTQGKDKYKSARQFVGDKKGVNEVMSDDFTIANAGFEENREYKRGNKKKDNRRPGKYSNKVAPSSQHVIAVLTNVKLPEVMTVKHFAETIKKTSADVIKKLMLMGIMASQNQEIDFDTAAVIASEYGITAEKEVVVSVEELLFDDEEDYDPEKDPAAVERPPVVVVMGHVDHGKTSLLDAIRSANVTEGEAGGITQHIGAYMVNINGRNITFLDTPGHEAFTAMRARGAQVTDVAIIVVAADDGVMPQTVEAINHAKAANVSIIVAVNKIDKPGANIERVKQELAEYELIPEDWGGDTIFVPVSAKKHENIETLLENVLLSADILQLKANPEKQARGTIIEAKLDKNKGPVATLLVQRGTLSQGDTIISGIAMGRVRTMTDDKGRAIKEAGPSTPVEITGMPEVPEAGEVFYAVKDERLARQLVEKRKTQMREKAMKSSAKVSLDALFSQIQEGSVKELNIVVKADVQGSVEAVKQSLEKLSNRV